MSACHTSIRVEPPGTVGIETDEMDLSGLDYIAEGRILIRTPEESNSGSCRIKISRQNELRFTVFVVIGGTVLDVYIDNERIDIIDPSNKTVYRLINNEENRELVPAISNLSVSEFKAIFWGRDILNNEPDLRFEYLDDKPIRVEKKTEHSHTIVNYTSWLSYQKKLIPKIISLETPKTDSSIKIVVTSFSPGAAEDLKILTYPDDYRLIDEFAAVSPE